MSTTILRTADAWWLGTPRGAARIDSDATTTGELLAEPQKIEAARASKQTVDPASLDLVSPVTAPCRVVAQMTNPKMREARRPAAPARAIRRWIQ